MRCPVIFQFQLLTSWGDPYYIGLTGLELYDERGERIPLSESSILPKGSRARGRGSADQSPVARWVGTGPTPALSQRTARTGTK